MIIKNLNFHVATGETDNSFIGLKIIDNQIHFYYPESYHIDTSDYERDDLLDLLITISIAKTCSSDTSNTFDSYINGSESALLSYIWILEDYLNNGFYINSEKCFKTNHNGRINWKRTLQQEPVISGSNVVFANLITEQKTPFENVLVEAYRYCIKKSANLIGWIYGITPNEFETIPNANKMVPLYLNAINLEMDNTYDDKKHYRFKHMKNILIGLDEISDDNSIVYGVDTYHYVFEQMIDKIFGTEKTEEYYPSFSWHLKYSNKNEGQPGPTIRPDTIMKVEGNNDIYIIDSKFYRYGSLDLSQTVGLPEASSVVKQMVYGSYVKSIYSDGDVYNVFILPYDAKTENAEAIIESDKTLVYVGDVSSKWNSNETYTHIHTFFIDLRWVVKIWNKVEHHEEINRLSEMIKDNIKVN